MDMAQPVDPEILQELKRAFDAREFYLRYQPIYQLDTLRIAAIEALMRWDHPRLDIIQPGDFIPLAEKSGLMESIGGWIFEQSFSDYERCLTENCNISQLFVKVSAEQLLANSFASKLVMALETCGLASHRITLEIKEDVFSHDNQKVISLFTRLRKLKFSICLENLDNYQAYDGYMSSGLINMVKLCRRSYDDESDEKKSEQIHALTEMKGIAVIAHGVETKSDLKRLQDLNIKYGQGYLLCTPLHIDDLLNL